MRPTESQSFAVPKGGPLDRGNVSKPSQTQLREARKLVSQGKTMDSRSKGPPKRHRQGTVGGIFRVSTKKPQKTITKYTQGVNEER